MTLCRILESEFMLEILPACFGARHTFVAMSALGMTLAHMLRVDLSVAIVSMVNTTSSAAAADNESEAVCGGGAAEDSSKDIFGVERRAIAPTLRAHVSHDYQSVTINRLVACTLKCIFL